MSINQIKIVMVLALSYPVPSSQKQEQSDPGRLPTNVVPVSYNISSIIFLEPDFSFEGSFEIDLDVTVGSEYDGSVTFHADQLVIDGEALALVDEDSGIPYQINSIQDQAEYDFVTVAYNNPPNDHSLKLSGTYSGNLKSNFGLYLDSYVDLATGQTRYLAATDFETNGARLAFPCLDEPELKATFDFRIGRPSNLNSVFNTPIVSQGDEDVQGHPGYVWDVYETTPIMSTYLISFGINDFSFEQSEFTTSNGVRHRSWARNDTIMAGYASYATNEVEPALLQFYEDTFGQTYPLSKMDQIAYPSYSSAMENWGLIVYAEDLFLWDATQTGAGEQEHVVSYLAHENAHNFFGNLVTCDWWDAIWLNEGLADYIMYLGTDAIEPEFEFWDHYYYYEFQNVMTYDGTTFSHPVIRDVETADDADFGLITYGKGNVLNRFLSSILTRGTFIRGLNTYLNDNTYGSVQFDDLWAPLNEASHTEGTLSQDYELKDIIETYMVQMNYPLLTVDYNSTSGMATLSQSRFLYDPENASPDDDFRWFVPITYTFVGDGVTDFGDSGPPGTFEGPAHNTFFMTPDEVSLDIDIGVSESPVVFNLQSSAYMRVNYNQDNWSKIKNQLQADHKSINIANRAALFNDAFALAVAGIEDFVLPLDIAQYLLRETKYMPMGVAFNIMKDLIESSTNDVSALALEDFLQGLFVGNYGNVGIDENLSNTHDQNQFQRTVVAAADYLKLPELDNDAGVVFNVWANATDPDDPLQNPVNRHIRPHVYCAAVREIGPSAVEFLQERLLNTALPQEIDSLTYALSCDQSREDSEVVASLLDKILRHPHQALTMRPTRLFEMALERSMVETLDWLDEHLSKLTEIVSQNTLSDIIASIMAKYNKKGEEIHHDQLANFQKSNGLDSRDMQRVVWAMNGALENQKRIRGPKS